MRLLKSVFLTAAFCAFTVTSYSQGVPKGPAAFSNKSEIDQARPRLRESAPGHSGRTEYATGCSAERKAIDVKDELIAELKKQIRELETKNPAVAKAGGAK